MSGETRRRPASIAVRLGRADSGTAGEVRLGQPGRFPLIAQVGSDRLVGFGKDGDRSHAFNVSHDTCLSEGLQYQCSAIPPCQTCVEPPGRRGRPHHGACARASNQPDQSDQQLSDRWGVNGGAPPWFGHGQRRRHRTYFRPLSG